MPRVTLLIFKIVQSVVLLGLTGCALFEERPGPNSSFGPREKVFGASFEDVWKSVNLVLQPYPLRVSNMDQGVLETDTIRAGRVWNSPYRSDPPSAGETYKLVLRVIKGSKGEKTATKVTIVKDSRLQTNFFSEAKQLPSDGLEEKALLYRVERELQIDRALARAQKKQNDKK